MDLRKSIKRILYKSNLYENLLPYRGKHITGWITFAGIIDSQLLTVSCLDNYHMTLQPDQNFQHDVRIKKIFLLDRIVFEGNLRCKAGSNFIITVSPQKITIYVGNWIDGYQAFHPEIAV